MSYTRTQWVESETPLSADNMNNIEDGIEEALAAVSDLDNNTYTKSEVYSKTEADNKYRTKADSYAKSDIFTVEKQANISASGTWNYTFTASELNNNDVSKLKIINLEYVMAHQASGLTMNISSYPGVLSGSAWPSITKNLDANKIDVSMYNNTSVSMIFKLTVMFLVIA